MVTDNGWEWRLILVDKGYYSADLKLWLEDAIGDYGYLMGPWMYFRFLGNYSFDGHHGSGLSMAYAGIQLCLHRQVFNMIQWSNHGFPSFPVLIDVDGRCSQAGGNRSNSHGGRGHATPHDSHGLLRTPPAQPSMVCHRSPHCWCTSTVYNGWA